MKRVTLLILTLSMLMSACLPASNSAPTVAPVSEADLQGTAAVLAQQTLDALAVLPSETAKPTKTPVLASPSPTQTATSDATATETQNAALLTLTATLGTGTVTTINAGTSTPTVTGTLPTATPSSTPDPAGVTATETLHAQTYGTLPPNLPFGDITLVNKAKAEAYISLQCTTKDGYTTILEYPVNGTMQVNAPAGRYVYVAWVGGKKMTGQFKLDKFQSLKITLYKDSIEVKQ